MAFTTVEEAQTRELIAQNAALLSLASNETTITSKLGAAKVNLGQLPAASALADADIFLVRQGTTDKYVAGSVLKGFVPTVGRLLGVQVFTASVTYTPTPGMKTAIVEVQGGGGGGGGAAATAAGQVATGAGGASGSYAKSRYTAAEIGASVAVTIGAAGAAGLAGNNNGGTGGTTSFGALVSAPGGPGGPGCGVTAPPLMRAGALGGSIPTGGNIINARGINGGAGIGVVDILGGHGAGSPITQGCGGGFGGGLNSNGGAATAPGAGGGAAATSNGAATSGGAGAPGQVIVWEFA